MIDAFAAQVAAAATTTTDRANADATAALGRGEPRGGSLSRLFGRG